MRLLGSFLVLALVAAASGAAIAQTKKPALPAPRPRAGSRAAPTKTDGGAFAPSASEATSGASDGGLVESKTLDGGLHVFRFSEIDIEGHLKSPQLVYFLRRVRAEFAAEDLGHRSFMREMSETRKEPSF